MQCPPQILGTFSNGRVESWIHMRPLKPEEMCEKSNAGWIAQRLATFHAADIDDIPKEPQVFQRLLTWYSISVLQPVCYIVPFQAAYLPLLFTALHLLCPHGVVLCTGLLISSCL